MTGHRFIGGQHEFFNDPVCNTARPSRHAGHLAKFIKLNHRLRQVEVNGAARHAFFIENQRQFAHQFETRNQRLIALALHRISFQQQMHIGVSHAFSATDHAASKSLGYHVATMIDLQ